MMPIILMLSGRARKVSYRCDGRKYSGPDLGIGKRQIRLLAEASLEIWSKKRTHAKVRNTVPQHHTRNIGHIYIVAPYGNAKS
jgi:hypothetical protein